MCERDRANDHQYKQREPTNEKYAERRAATFLYRYCTGEVPPGEADLEPWECELY